MTPACSCDDDSSVGGSGGADSSGGEDSASGDSGADGSASGGDGTMACHEYGPGEAGGIDFTPLFDEATIASLDFDIAWPDTPIAAIDAATSYLERTEGIRVSLTGLVQVDHEDPSTLTSFHDVPLWGLGPDNFTLSADGVALQPASVTCTGNETTPITVVFAIDVTGSMSPVIAAVRDSLVDFVDTAVALGLRGKVGVVTFQDTVGVDIGFEDCSGIEGLIPERSPFLAPVPLDDPDQVEQLRDFIGALHADGGSDLPENLAGAVDFATHNVIGYTQGGAPNVIGEGDDDPPWTSPWPVDQLEGLVVVIAVTDATFHDADTASSSLRPDFRPRAPREIVAELGAVLVNSVDPALLDTDHDIEALPDEIDADFWPMYTGGFGVDRWKVSAFGIEESVSLFDLELLVLGNGLLEIPLAPALAATCVLEAPLAEVPEQVRVDVTHEAGAVAYTMVPRFVGQ
ncbi:MAG: VWA domain-containing protein [Nannocystaceae bacterium]|nr:VWA domain-containing protein [Nannocystaceae bacterium]